MNKGVNTWTEERTELCKKLWLAGDSAGVVALALGGVSRAGVIGKMNRLGIKRPNQQPTRSLGYPQRASYKQARRRAQPAPAFVSPNWKDGKALPPTLPTTRGADIESPNAGPWIARTALQCAFPVGEETGAGQWSCCNPTEPGVSYCPAHQQLAYRGTPKPNTTYVERKARQRPNYKEWAA